MTAPSPLAIDFYSEITCPWCLLGQHRLDKVLRERFSDLAVSIRHHPVLLLPDAPDEGLLIRDLLKRRYGITDPKQAFARVEAEAMVSGLDLDLSLQPYSYPTQSAHAVIQAAGGTELQHHLAVAITKAYFLDARNIADHGVLVEIAEAAGFGKDHAAAVLRDPDLRPNIEKLASAATAKGVTSVPHLVLGGSVSISGGQGEDKIADAILSAIAASSASPER